jgi:hypothetical protein
VSTKWIVVEGGRYPVVESLGYNQDMGARAWIVQTQNGEKTAVGPSTKARFWTPADRIRPLREHSERMARQRRQMESGE